MPAMISNQVVRQRFAAFWQSRKHREVPPIPLVPKDDPTTLFTGSGMQQLVPNLLGAPHPLGTRLYNIQGCVRSQDIDEVGDNRHDTYFEMMGNWSLGDYFKQDQLRWVFDLYTNKEYGFGLDPARLYVTVYGGGEGIPKDDESIGLWRSLFGEANVPSQVGTPETFHPDQHITLYGADKNWWSRSGSPSNMPIGEVGGPDSEIFYDFGEDRLQHETALVKDSICHVNCDCGRFMEIGNSVFVQYVKQPDGSLKELPNRNVDFGGGLERVLAAMHDDPDVFRTDAFSPIIRKLTDRYDSIDEDSRRRTRIIADHLRTAIKLASDGVHPGPKEQGYLLRSLIRRALLHANHLSISNSSLMNAIRAVGEVFPAIDIPSNSQVIVSEINRYRSTVESGEKELKKRLSKNPKVMITGDVVFEIFQSTGLPPDVIVDIGNSVGAVVDLSGFEEAKARHSELSRSGSGQKFKGGLADQSEQVIRYHTATHLLHQALYDVLGGSVRQEGSNITGSRLRFDFSCDHRPTPEQIHKIAIKVNQKIRESLPVNHVILPKEAAERLGAKSFFKEKYPDMVKVYVIGATQDEIQSVIEHPDDCRLTTAYSVEFCGGPHVHNTKEIDTIDLYKVEKIGKDLYRVYAR